MTVMIYSTLKAYKYNDTVNKLVWKAIYDFCNMSLCKQVFLIFRVQESVIEYLSSIIYIQKPSFQNLLSSYES